LTRLDEQVWLADAQDRVQVGLTMAEAPDCALAPTARLVPGMGTGSTT